MKFATRFALSALAAGAVVTAGATAWTPESAASPITPTQTPATVAAPGAKDYWEIRLDAGTTRLLGQADLTEEAMAAQMATIRLDLPAALRNAAFYGWVASSTSKSALNYGPNPCVRTLVPVVQEARYSFATTTTYPSCPWQVPSVTTVRR